MRGSCHFVIITGFCMRIKWNLSPNWVIQEVRTEEEEQEYGCEEIHFSQNGWKVKWEVAFRNGGSGRLSRLDWTHTHTRTRTPLPFMVAKGLLPMRAWFTAVLTPIIVFLKMRINPKLPLTRASKSCWQRDGSTNKRCFWCLVAVLRQRLFSCSACFFFFFLNCSPMYLFIYLRSKLLTTF